KAEPKRVAVSFQNQLWKKVLEWLAEEARLPVVAQQIPTGTFTCVSPPGRTYSLAEVIDLMNEGLTASRFRLHRGPASVVLLPADERPDPGLVATVRPEDLAARGRTEVVRVVLSLKTLQAKDLVPEVKKLLGPFGEVGTLANRLVLQDTVQNLRQVLKTLQELDAQAPAAPALKSVIVELIPLASLSAVRTVETLKSMFGGPGGPYLEADADRQALIVRGTVEQVQEIKSALRALRDAPAAPTTRTFPLERGSALALAEALQDMIRQTRPNPVRVIVPGQKSEPPGRAPAKGPDKPRPPLTLTAVGNKLIVSCDDPQILALVEELTRLLTQAGGEGEFTVIRLRSGNAVEVARVLAETFNGPAGAKVPGRVRIVADPTANALLVRASPLDLLTIRHLLRTALDIERQEAEAVIQTWVIGPLKHAQAAEVAMVLTAVYRGEAGRAGFVVTADQRTNTLVLRCTQPVFQDAKRLADQLDTKTAENVK
ncbi:MAG TPA: secretin N-terminal domain-containing protein, partial [Gemmataceae bacterium]|nr:secretin N-terminal domain-containing protein [Gemmataceae bacterium]